MRNVGPDVKKNTGLGLAKQAQKDFMAAWLIDNQLLFKETMEAIREHAPVQYAKLYLEAMKMQSERQQNITFNINRQQDREDLQALVRTRVTPALTQQGEFVPYTEVEASPSFLPPPITKAR